MSTWYVVFVQQIVSVLFTKPILGMLSQQGKTSHRVKLNCLRAKLTMKNLLAELLFFVAAAQC